jgi:hypothetical protein
MTYPIEQIMKGDIYVEERPKRKPKSFRSRLSSKEIAEILTARIRELTPQFRTIESFKLQGKLNESIVKIEFSNWGEHTLRYMEGDIRFNVEDKDYRRGTEKSKVSTPDEAEQARSFLETLCRKQGQDREAQTQKLLPKFFDPPPR